MCFDYKENNVMKNMKLEKTEIKKFTVKGTLSADGTIITYLDDDKVESEISVDKCFESFSGGEIQLSISNKVTEDLTDEE